MREIETDYLVIGAGGDRTGVHRCVDRFDSDADVVMVDRRHPTGRSLERRLPLRPAAPALLVLRRELAGARDRPDRRGRGANAGFYHRATLGARICELLLSVSSRSTCCHPDRVRFFPALGATTAATGIRRALVRLPDSPARPPRCACVASLSSTRTNQWRPGPVDATRPALRDRSRWTRVIPVNRTGGC